jgi:MoaA/NifB/PqqE/SkfB family radical SAM enzyme
MANARRLAGEALGRPFIGPRTVSLEVTHGCNLRCAFCESHGPTIEKPITARRVYAGGRRTMDLATVTRLARDLRREGTTLIELSGKGEPTTHPQFVQFVNAIKDAGLECALVTNGTTAPPDLVATMIARGFDRLTVSLNAGSPEVYARVNGRDELWDRAVGFLRATMEGRRAAGTMLPWTRVSHVVCKENVADMDNMVRVAVDLGVDEVVWCVLGELPTTRHLRLDPDDVGRVRERVPVWVRQFSDAGIVHNLATFARELTLRPEGAAVQQNPLQRAIPCYEAWRFSVIGPDGAAVPCCYCEEEVLGNIVEDGFRAVWRGAKYQDLRRRMLSMPKTGRPICGECFTNCNRAQENLHVYRRIHPLDRGGPGAK